MHDEVPLFVHLPLINDEHKLVIKRNELPRKVRLHKEWINRVQFPCDLNNMKAAIIVQNMYRFISSQWQISKNYSCSSTCEELHTGNRPQPLQSHHCNFYRRSCLLHSMSHQLPIKISNHSTMIGWKESRYKP